MSDTINISRRWSSVFWMEFKALDAWPAKDTTAPLKNVFEPGQIPFLREWKHWGGYGFVILRVGVDDWFLLNPDEPLDEMTDVELISHSVCCGLGSIMEYLENLHED